MARSSASLASILAPADDARFFVAVSGSIDGVDILHDIPVSTVPNSASDVAAFVFNAVTGKRLSLRRWEWSLSGNRTDGSTYFTLCDGKGEVTGSLRFSIRRAPAVIESRPNAWAELTAEEQREATDRGFPRGADVRYILNRAAKPHATPRQWQLVRWTRIKPEAASTAPIVPVAPADDIADVACRAFDISFRNGMRDSRCLPVRDIRRKAMMAAVTAGVMMLASMSAEAGERATFLHNAARACGVSTAIAAPSYDAEYDRQHGANTARHFAGMGKAQRADICRGVMATIGKVGARLGVTVACDTDADCERKNGRL